MRDWDFEDELHKTVERSLKMEVRFPFKFNTRTRLSLPVIPPYPFNRARFSYQGNYLSIAQLKHIDMTAYKDGDEFPETRAFDASKCYALPGFADFVVGTHLNSW